MSAKPDQEVTSNIAERITAVAYIGGFISLIIIAGLMGKSGSPYTWIPISFLIADIVGGIYFLATNDRSIKLALAVLAMMIFLVAGLDVFTRAVNAVIDLVVQVKTFLEMLMNAQPDITTTMGQISLGIEIATVMVFSIAAFIAVSARNKQVDKEYHWDPKHTIAIVLMLYALTRGMFVVTFVMILVSLGVVNLVKAHFQEGAKAVEAQASKRGWNTLALFITAAAFVVAAFIFTPFATWVGGIAVIYSAHPFTTLTFVVTGSVIGGWYALE